MELRTSQVVAKLAVRRILLVKLIRPQVCRVGTRVISEALHMKTPITVCAHGLLSDGDMKINGARKKIMNRHAPEAYKFSSCADVDCLELVTCRHRYP